VHCLYCIDLQCIFIAIIGMYDQSCFGGPHTSLSSNKNGFYTPPICKNTGSFVIINDCIIAVGAGDVVECAASFITWVKLASPIGIAAGGSVNLSTMSPAFVRKGMTKILQNSAFVSYASTFLHLQLRLTQFFAFFLQTRRLSRTSFSLQHFLLTINFLM
jgi:hypothetical protein